MRATAWFAALCVSLGAAGVQADGFELSVRTRAALARDAAEIAGAQSGPLVREVPGVHRPLAVHDGSPLWLTPCAHADGCRDAPEGRLVYRGARRYMPAFEGLAPEGISLRRDRLVLRYSFR